MNNLTLGQPFQVSAIGAPSPHNWEGGISEILIYNRKLTPEEEFEVGSYLAGKYGVPIPEPSSSALMVLGALAFSTRRRRR